MDKLNKIKNGTELLQSCIDNGISINECIRRNSLPEKFFRNLREMVNRLINNREDENPEMQEAFDDFFAAYEQAKTISKTSTFHTKVEKTGDKNLDIDEKFDDRSRTWTERDDDGNILYYHFHILVRDEKPFIGKLTREDMERIHAQYPFLTRNEVSKGFLYFTDIQFKRILRVFNITKDRVFPAHIIEEQSEEDLVEIRYKNKEASAHRKFIEKKGVLVEKALRDTQFELFKLKEERKWYEGVVEQLFEQRQSENKIVKQIFNFTPALPINTTYTFFGDVHFGKKFHVDPSLKYRGNNKDILRERCLKVANETVNEALTKKSSVVKMVCTGDIFESLRNEGMHPDHVFEMDLYGHEQLSYGIEVFEEMFEILINNLPSDTVIDFYGIGGNHDRLGKMRDEDKKRTGSLIFYSFLKKIINLKYPEGKVNIIFNEENIIAFSHGKISVIAFHGDSGLMKRNPLELMNMFKVGDNQNYTVLINGHWHTIKTEEGINYIQVGVGSVCSLDNFVKNELGKGSLPSFLIGHESERYGFDFRKVTLY